jgi:transposase
MAPIKPDAGTRIQALTMLQNKTPIAKIIEATGYKERNIYRILKTAKERGYNPDKSKTLYLSYVEDAPRSGRPKKATPEVEEQVIKAISKNSTTRELSTQKIADIISPLVKGGISARTVHRILRRRGYKPCKPTRKPGLTKENKIARLNWCLAHKDWTLED